jgi:hypothetical protein
MGRGNDLHWGLDGNLYVDNFFGSGQILRYDPQGNPLPSGSRTGANFTDPVAGYWANGFAFGPDGKLYVAEVNKSTNNGEILQHDPNGDLLGTFVATGTAGVRFIDSIRFGPNGNLYVADESSGTTGRVLEFSGQDGSLVSVFVDTHSGGINLPAGLLFYDDGASPHTSAAQGRHALPDPTLGSARLAAGRSGQVHASLNAAVGTGNHPTARIPVARETMVSQRDSATGRAGARSSPAIDHLAEGAFPDLSLVGADLSDLR